MSMRLSLANLRCQVCQLEVLQVQEEPLLLLVVMPVLLKRRRRKRKKKARKNLMTTWALDCSINQQGSNYDLICKSTKK